MTQPRDARLPPVLSPWLYVEDNPGDVALARFVLKDAGLRVDLHSVETGEEALRFLRQSTPYSDAPTPHIILLDLHLPGMDGLETLEAIRRQSPATPVLVFSATGDERELAACYDRQANACLPKPVNADEFAAVLQNAARFWGSVARVPATAAPGVLTRAAGAGR